jgi:hypothetical protein
LVGQLQAVDHEFGDRNEQLYRLHNVFTYRKNLEALKRIEEEFKNCKFEPDISPRSDLVQSRYMEPKINHQERLEL